MLYADVSPGIWYEEALRSLAGSGYVDTHQTLFRPADTATRAEFVKLLVGLNGGELSKPPPSGSFEDVSINAWYFPYFEEAAKAGWIHGEGNCLGTRPCFARPAAPVIRAEAAVLLARASGIKGTENSPSFADVPRGQWFFDAFGALGHFCVIGNGLSGDPAYPFRPMSRAEMVVMIHRLDDNINLGMTCDDIPDNESL